MMAGASLQGAMTRRCKCGKLFEEMVKSHFIVSYSGLRKT